MRRIFLNSLICGLLFSQGFLPAQAQSGGGSPYLGQIMWVPFNFAPVGWSTCDGQILPIAQNTALFSLLGTTYGGDGRTTFALPNLQGRLLINAGQGAGLSNYVLGQTGGEESHTLTADEIPSHSHAFNTTTSKATLTDPSQVQLGQPAGNYLYGATATTTMATTMLAKTGGGQAHNNLMPHTTLTCIIAVQGLFPARN